MGKDLKNTYAKIRNSETFPDKIVTHLSGEMQYRK
jgi:hypothetical protein